MQAMIGGAMRERYEISKVIVPFRLQLWPYGRVEFNSASSIGCTYPKEPPGRIAPLLELL